ncbi:MAG: hypothetical protein ING16_15625 [Roseomonas sp.]|nr:hypothetical protein [Roseomonas sp.]
MSNGGISARLNPKAIKVKPEILRPPTRVPTEKLVRSIRRATRKLHSARDKVRILS